MNDFEKLFEELKLKVGEIQNELKFSILFTTLNIVITLDNIYIINEILNENNLSDFEFTIYKTTNNNKKIMICYGSFNTLKNVYLLNNIEFYGNYYEDNNLKAHIYKLLYIIVKNVTNTTYYTFLNYQTDYFKEVLKFKTHLVLYKYGN